MQTEMRIVPKEVLGGVIRALYRAFVAPRLEWPTDQGSLGTLTIDMPK